MDGSLRHARSRHYIGAAALLLVALQVSAGASTVFVVDSTVDAPDVNPGDSVCASATNGCTLRAAVEEANATPGADWIQLEDLETYALGAAGELPITDDVGIGLPYLSATIDGAGITRILHVHPGVS
jgi:CSLREA domain-containing protein